MKKLKSKKRTLKFPPPQKDTIMLWCSSNKVDLERALSYYFDSFEEE